MTRSTGVRRKVDDLGRVVIPAGIRRSLDIRDGDAVEFTVDGDNIILSRATDRCVICGHQGIGLREVQERKICGPCIQSVTAMGGSDVEDPADGPADPVADEPADEDGQAPVVSLPRKDDEEETRSPLERESADLDTLRRELYDPASTTAW